MSPEMIARPLRRLYRLPLMDAVQQDVPSSSTSAMPSERFPLPSGLRGRACLDRWAPGDAPAELATAKSVCARIAGGAVENFSVMSGLIPAEAREGFQAIYAYCRISDDLGDEVGSREGATAWLNWWRGALADCFAGRASHPVFVALTPVIARHGLTIEPFDALLRAFLRDQVQTRYASWEDACSYCRESANPVGRLVLGVLDERDPRAFLASDEVCTALQLTNHWQDVRRDLVERDRIYVPSELFPGERFEERLRSTIEVGHAPDRMFLAEWRECIAECVRRTEPMFDRVDELEQTLRPPHRALVWLFAQGGRSTLERIVQWNGESCLDRPRLHAAEKAWLVWRAVWRARRVRGQS